MPLVQRGLNLTGKQQKALVTAQRTMLANIGFLLAERRRLGAETQVTKPHVTHNDTC